MQQNFLLFCDFALDGEIERAISFFMDPMSKNFNKELEGSVVYKNAPPEPTINDFDLDFDLTEIKEIVRSNPYLQIMDLKKIC